MIDRILPLLLLLYLVPITLWAQEPHALIQPGQARGGWSFDNGQEFPGATGELNLADQHFREQPVLALRGNFTKGGNYVQAAVNLPKTPIDTLSFWIKPPVEATSIPVRLIDGSGQCHQLNLKLNDKGGWQQISLPVETFFERFGKAGALDLASKYEQWGGANDGRWHQPGRLFVILGSRSLGETPEVLLSDVQLIPPPPKVSVSRVIPLDPWLSQGESVWEYNGGLEFQGAKGGLKHLADEQAIHLHADFTEGGEYVGARRTFPPMDIQAMPSIRVKMRTSTAQQFALRLVDATGQCHQRKGLRLNPDGAWHEVEIVPSEIAGGEHWGGANDGTWHEPIQLMEVMLNTRSSTARKPELSLAHFRAEVLVQASAGERSYAESFESPEAFQSRWTTRGDVQIAVPGAALSKGALELRRGLNDVGDETAAVSEAFPVSAGLWQLDYAWRSALESPDNSYHGSVSLVVAGETGAILETLPGGIGFTKNDWQSVSKTVELPAQAARARFRIDLKKTWGSFQVDDLSATRLAVQPIAQRVKRVLIDGTALGHLFLPEESVRFDVKVEANGPLPVAERVIQYSVRDAGGADWMVPAELPLIRSESAKGRFEYAAAITLPSSALQVGKFYELHVAVPQGAGEPFREYSGFAVLPPAPALAYPADQIPFTIRNWDSRIPDYFHLANRLGIRQIGVWGGWSKQAPYKPHAPGIDVVKSLNAKWITGTPAADVERNGFKNYSETALREGMKNFLEAFAAPDMAMIAMGNEPHGTGQKVLDNVKAYRAIYETVKAFDPGIHVIGTSVEPNEEYFRAGYQRYLDSYDFHIYEHYTHVRSTMRQYRELMQKYDAVKPLHSTELGLNSQGLTRRAVSREMIKKLTVFFAEGGATVSWFTIQYPDPEGKARGQFGDAHCMFDCKYNLYNPRLDAITYYHLQNGIGNKTFREEKHYKGGAQAYLFRDAEDSCFQLLWSDEGREDVFLPLPPKCKVTMVSVDGTTREMYSGAGGVHLTLSEDPVMLRYSAPDASLAPSLGTPVCSVEGPLPMVVAGSSTRLTLVGRDGRADTLRVVCPPRWRASLQQDGDEQVTVSLQAPETTAAREVRIQVETWIDERCTGVVDLVITVQPDPQ